MLIDGSHNFSERYPTAATNAGPLSVMTSATPPYWQRISSKMKSPRVSHFPSKVGATQPMMKAAMHLDEVLKNLFTVSMSIVSM